jgi:hypothetical protein
MSTGLKVQNSGRHITKLSDNKFLLNELPPIAPISNFQIHILLRATVCNGEELHHSNKNVQLFYNGKILSSLFPMYSFYNN